MLFSSLLFHLLLFISLYFVLIPFTSLGFPLPLMYFLYSSFTFAFPFNFFPLLSSFLFYFPIIFFYFLLLYVALIYSHYISLLPFNLLKCPVFPFSSFYSIMLIFSSLYFGLLLIPSVNPLSLLYPLSSHEFPVMFLQFSLLYFTSLYFCYSLFLFEKCLFLYTSFQFRLLPLILYTPFNFSAIDYLTSLYLSLNPLFPFQFCFP